jgi:hypothetical protein
MKIINRRGRWFRPTGWAAAVMLLLSGCDFGLEELNVDTTSLREVEPEFQLNQEIVGLGPGGNDLRCEATVVQQFVRISTGVGACANFNVKSLQTMGHQWGGNYGDMLELGDAMRRIEEANEGTPSSDDQNVFNMARIIYTLAAMRITDTHGDAPYSEAVQALEGIVFPVYDSQETIYTGSGGLLEEFRNASAALSASLPAPDDALYGGDIEKWRRFGNSLLLRAAMRLTKVAPSVAQQYAAAAVQGGVMQSNDDNAVIRHDANFPSGQGQTANGNEAGNEYIPEAFVDHLQSRNDPRMGAIGARWPSAADVPDQATTNGRTIASEDQIGMPMGYDQNTILGVLPDYGLTSHYQFTRGDPFRIYNQLAPDFVVSYAQTQLLLAEAAFRGWVSGDPATYYENAIRADMERLSTAYGISDMVIPQSEIDAFVAAHPLDMNNALEEINNEYWVVSFVTPNENWSNFRRSGYPAIPPNPLHGDLNNEDFFRRLPYPGSEANLNPNYPLSGSSADNMDLRVWWDVSMAGTGGVGPNG